MTLGVFNGVLRHKLWLTPVAIHTNGYHHARKLSMASASYGFGVYFYRVIFSKSFGNNSK
jgi:hypothetical protein